VLAASRKHQFTASYSEAQKALEKYLKYLESTKPLTEEWKPGENPFLDERGIRLEKTLTWAKLAVLHEKNRNISDADTAWTQAERLANEGTWKDPSRDNLRKIVTKQLPLAGT
jgi:AICAR transformylase/IMP cyclohydrolase PurH